MSVRILSGIQPSGKLHIGNYFGMIKPMVEHQSEGDLFCFVADLHSLTSLSDGAALRRNINDALLDLVALGIDSDKSTLWVQSDVKEVLELTWYLHTVTPMGLLQRCHSYKDKVAKGLAASSGLFTYPVLMAADLLMFNSNIVPVGRDQKQHVEVTRDIAIKFNATFGEIFTLPEPRIKEELAVIPGIDGQKMSKSYGNTIEMFLPEKELKKKIMGIITDSKGVEDPKDPDSSYLYTLYKLFASESDAATFAGKMRQGGFGYGDAKKELFALIMDTFKTARQTREQLAADPSYIAGLRAKGADKARATAVPLLDKIRKVVGIV